jgi:HNH endonuclease
VAKCHRGSIPRNTERELWGRSGGYCSNPSCRANLIIETTTGRAVAIAELAHVIAWSPNGPRGAELGLSEDVDAPTNLILLCPTCHRVADEAPDDFPPALLRDWRETRASVVTRVAGMPRYASRDELAAEIRRLLRENGAIHRQYGPESAAALDPMSDAAETWRREALRVVLPNNRRILELSAANEPLLDDADHEALTRFRVHADGFGYNQLSGDKDPSAPRFPAEMSERFE